MISLQNPSIPAPLQAVEIDRAIYQLQLRLDTNLGWLSHEYGRAYRHKSLKGGNVYFPEVYVGQSLDGAYYRPTPDNDKSGMCFFVVKQEEQPEFDRNVHNYLRWDVGIIFWVNLKLIDEALYQNELFTQNLIREVRSVLTRKLGGLDFSLRIQNVQREFDEVYREFTIEEDKPYLKAPYQAFRFNCDITLREECDTTINPISEINNVLSPLEIVKAVIPNIDFSDDFYFDALTAQQKVDLLAKLQP